MKPVIEYSDFDRLDVRVGRVMTAAAPDWSQKLLEFTVDFGLEIGQRTIFGGVRQWYEPEQFVGNQYLFIVNLTEKKMGQGVSQGMMLMADSPGQPVPLRVHEAVTPGTSVR